MYYGPEALATLFADGKTQQLVKGLGAKAHFTDISKGILDTRDILYFLSLSAFFIYLAIYRLSNKTKGK